MTGTIAASLNAIRCDCGKALYDGRVLVCRVAFVDVGCLVIRCPDCKRNVKTDRIRIVEGPCGGEVEII